MFIREDVLQHVKSKHLRFVVKLMLDGQLAAWAWVYCYYVFPDAGFSVLDATLWALLALACSGIFGLARLHYRLVGIDDLFPIGFVGLYMFIAASAINVLSGGRLLDRSYSFLFLAGVLTTGLWTMLRVSIRALGDGIIRLPKTMTTLYRPGRKTLIIGAGHGGSKVAEELTRHPELEASVVGFVDDALEKQGLRVQGYPVLGTTELLPMIIEQNEVEKVILAIPSASGKQIQELRQRLAPFNVEFKTVPGIYNLLGPQTWAPEIRDISIEDLLRRDPVILDQSALRHHLGESVVLITGGGGSIGSEIARQVAAYSPRRIVLLGRGENSLWLAERELRQRFPGVSLSVELCDIRNAHRLRQAFSHWEPQVVFHAAAHKHVPFLEEYPEEAIENNVFGTKNVVDAALAAGVRILVNISTDKSVNPTNVLGVSKYLAEQVVREGSSRAPLGSLFVSVRFGNVLGSRGSVIPVFKEQIQKGGPVTVTDPQMTRYFMTIPEASQLVLQAGLLGRTGHVYVLDMGDPVPIVNLAKDMISLSGFVPEQDIEITYTGVRPGEKLFEELFNTAETHHTQIHDKVFEADTECTPPLMLEDGLKSLRQAMAKGEDRRRREFLKWFQLLVPTYTPSPTGLGRYAEAGEEVSTGAA